MGEARRRSDKEAVALAVYREALGTAVKIWDQGNRLAGAKAALFAAFMFNKEVGIQDQDTPLLGLMASLEDFENGRPSDWLKPSAGGTSLTTAKMRACRAAAIGTLISLERQGWSRDEAAIRIAEILARNGVRVKKEPTTDRHIKRWWRDRADSKRGPGAGLKRLWSGEGTAGLKPDRLLEKLEAMAGTHFNAEGPRTKPVPSLVRT